MNSNAADAKGLNGRNFVFLNNEEYDGYVDEPRDTTYSNLV